MDIEKIAAALAIATTIIGLGRFFLRRLRFTRLTKEEEEVLAACAERGEIRVLSTDAYGEWVRADSTDFTLNGDRSYAARYLEALHRMEARGLAKHEAGFLHRLTGSGFAAARSINGKRKKEQFQN